MNMQNYPIHKEIPLINRTIAGIIFVFQHPFRGSAFLEQLRKRNVISINRKLKARLAAKGQKKGQTIPVPRVEDITDTEFVKHFLNKSLPVVFVGQAKNWECTKKWNLDFLKESLGKSQIAILESSGLVEKEFDKTNGSSEPVVTEEMAADDFVNCLKSGQKKYLRFSPLMEEHRKLIKDLDLAWLKKMRRCFFGIGYQTFIGAAKRTTPIHAGTTAFFYIMADGEKKWTLFSASSSALLNPNPSGRVYNFSNVNISNPDLNLFPGFDLLTRYECHLKKGDILFVPTWMWHEVENLTESWGVSYRFTSLRGFVRYPHFLFVRIFLTKPSFFKIFYNTVLSRKANKANTTIITPQIYMND